MCWTSVLSVSGHWQSGEHLRLRLWGVRTTEHTELGRLLAGRAGCARHARGGAAHARACEHADAGAALPVPDADGLVVAGGDHPGVLLVELHRPDVVQVAQQREEASPQLVVPHLERRQV